MMLQCKGLKALAKALKERLLELEPKFSILDNSATLYHRTSVTIFALQNLNLRQSKCRMNIVSWWH